MKNYYSENGFTLVEIVISAAILAIVAVSLVALFTTGFGGIFRAGDKSVAHFLAQEELENMLAQNHPTVGTTVYMHFNGGGLQNHLITVNGHLATDTANHLSAFLPSATVDTGTRISVTGVAIQPVGPTTMFVNQTLQLTAAVSPANATNKNVNWESSDQQIVTVTSSGLVTAVGLGNVSVTVRTLDGGHTAVASINVTPRLTFADIPFDRPERSFVYIPALGNFQKIHNNALLRRANTGDNDWTDTNGSANQYRPANLPWITNSRLLSRTEAAELLPAVRNNGFAWWTSTSGPTNNHYFYVTSTGLILEERRNERLGVRPALFLNNPPNVTGGSGTESDPFRLGP